MRHGQPFGNRAVFGSARLITSRYSLLMQMRSFIHSQVRRKERKAWVGPGVRGLKRTAGRGGHVGRQAEPADDAVRRCMGVVKPELDRGFRDVASVANSAPEPPHPLLHSIQEQREG